MRYCSYQERSPFEVKQKLREYALPSDKVDELMDLLIDDNFINEERFAVAYVRGKFIYKKWGRNKIRMELKRRKISDYCIKKGFEEIDGDKYEEVLLGLLQKKIESLKAIKGYQKNYKAAQFVMNKGYEGDIVWSLIKMHFQR
jgi:regulatory protein